MKKAYAIFITTLFLFTMQTSHAVSMSRENACVLVPHAVFTAPLTTTVVGLISDSASGASARIYWAFFDVSGAQRANGNFMAGPDQLSGFVWSDAASNSLQGVDGFLLFCQDDDNNTQITNADDNHLAGSAFFVDTSSNDVAFIPTLQVDDSDLNQSDPAQWNAGMPIIDISDEQDLDAGDQSFFQYAINGTPNNGDDTTLYIWGSGNTLGNSQNMTVFSDTGVSAPITVLTPNAYLNAIDIESISSLPPGLTSGFIRWTIPASFANPAEAFLYTVVRSPSFGAAQTLVGSEP